MGTGRVFRVPVTRGAMLGLEFWVQFRRPIYADETISLEWLVISVKKARSAQW